MNSLGNRMKDYERVSQTFLTPRSCAVIRVDGQAFHTFTRGFKKPFDSDLMSLMDYAAKSLSEIIQGFKIGYVQSDEASFLITDFDKLETQGWFNYEVNKIISISACEMSNAFNKKNMFLKKDYNIPLARFDSRVFIIPNPDVSNYFLWRMKDWERNSLQMYARSFFSQKQLYNKKCSDIHEMLHEIGKNWATDLTPREKNGLLFTKKDDYYISPRYEEVNQIINPLIQESAL